MESRVDVIVVADKVKGGNWEGALEIMKNLSSIGYRISSASLVLYHEWSLPLLDPTPDPAAPASVYSEVEPMPGRPEPCLGLREAYSLVADYGRELGEPRVLLLWSAAARPKLRLDLCLKLLESMRVPVGLVVLRPSLPGWARYVGVPERYYTLRSTTSRLKLVSKALGL